jgi:putative ABC transport system permease protein
MGERIFKALLLLYPRRFRHRFGEEQAEFYRQERRALGTHPGAGRILAFWTKTLGDSVAAAARLRVRAIVGRNRGADRDGADMQQELCESRGPSVGDLLQDIRLALRMLRRRPVFSSLVVGTLGLGIGGTTALFSVVNSVLLKSLPYSESERLAYVGSSWEGARPSGMTPPEFLALHASTRTFATLAASRHTTLDVTGGEQPERLTVSAVTADYFRVVGVQPVLGRAFGEDDFAPGSGHRIVILSYDVWRRRWGGDPAIIGATFRASEHYSEGMFTFTIVGVMPPGYRHPESMEGHPYPAPSETQVWTPLTLEGTPEAELWTAFRLKVVGRLRRDRSIDDAHAEAQSLAAVLATQHPEFYTGRYMEGRSLAVAPLLDYTVGNRRGDLLLLFGGAGLLLLIAAANVLSLFLARELERTRESAIRTALGARSSRIVRHFVVESTLLALLGSLVGIGIAGMLVRVLPTLLPADFPRVDAIAVDLRAAIFAGTLAVLIGALCGLVPSLLNARWSTVWSLGSRGGVQRGTTRLRGGLVAVEIALSLTLLTGAGLLVNSYARLQHVNPGFDPQSLLLMPIQLPLSYDRDESRLTFFIGLDGRLRAVPGVRAVSWIEDPPMGYGNAHTGIILQEADPKAEPPVLLYHRVGPRYFHTMGIPILKGRDFERADDASSERVAVVDQAMAEQYWPGQNPIGRRFRRVSDPEDHWSTVIGVVGTVLQASPAEEGYPHVYFPFLQDASDLRSVMIVHTGLGLDGVGPQLRAAVWDLDPDLPVPMIERMQDRIGNVLRLRRLRTVLVGVFALSALVLSLAGIYALMLYLVTGRFREIGIRMALGADTGRVLWTVSRHSLLLIAIGTAVGLTMGGVASRLLAGLLFGISRFDVPTYLTVAVVFDAAALLGCLVPALRAVRLDPTLVLRNE